MHREYFCRQEFQCQMETCFNGTSGLLCNIMDNRVNFNLWWQYKLSQPNENFSSLLCGWESNQSKLSLETMRPLEEKL